MVSRTPFGIKYLGFTKLDIYKCPKKISKKLFPKEFCEKTLHV
jgi:hypothetical protein